MSAGGSETDDRRLRTRSDLDSGMRVRLGDATYHGWCVNISMSGALLEIHDESRLNRDELVGQQGRLELWHHCGDEEIDVRADFEVVRVPPCDPSPESTRIAVALTKLDTDSSIHLYNLVRWQAGDD